MLKYILFPFLWLVFGMALGQEINPVPGAERPELYIPLLEGKRTALVVNQTSIAFDRHLVDFLVSRRINVEKIFAPEHGFRGTADAGGRISDHVDPSTGIPVVSLYGSKTKPTAEDLRNIDVVVYDIQDVGVRFYTYISTLHLVMESCAENQVKLMIFDRPDPNGDYVDGPVLEDSLKSFVGMDPLPVVYGLTPGELAGMMNGQRWLKDGLQCDLDVIPVKNYDHSMIYSLPVKPSPNLPNDISVRLYPSICLFEGTIMSVGRGTDFPFQVAGYPDPAAGNFSFTPSGREGASSPKYNGQECFGKDYRNVSPLPHFTLAFLLDFYYRLGSKYDFFNNYFDTLAGTGQLKKQILAGFNEEDIRITWFEGLKKYKEIRKKYLLYPDFN